MCRKPLNQLELILNPKILYTMRSGTFDRPKNSFERNTLGLYFAFSLVGFYIENVACYVDDFTDFWIVYNFCRSRIEQYSYNEAEIF